jgi:hypothetical protein
MAAKKPAASKSAKSVSTKSAPRSSSRSHRSSGKESTKAGEKLVTIDRRRASRRDEPVDAEAAAAPAPALERRQKVQRRRQIDPTTCERDYSVEEVEFMNAMDEYKRTSGRMFPTCSEVLEVIRGMGYVKLSQSERNLLGIEENQNVEEKLDVVNDAVDELMDEAL